MYHNNTKYIGYLRNGIVTVRVQRTAQGMMLVAGTYDVATKKWMDGKKNAVPRQVADIMLETFKV